MRTDVFLGARLLAGVAALAVVAPSERALSPLGAIALIAAYALTQWIRFDVGTGYTVPSQLVFVPMLVLAPPRSFRCSSQRAAIAELRRCSGEQFDPAVANALVEIVARRPAPRAARELIALAA